MKHSKQPVVILDNDKDYFFKMTRESSVDQRGTRNILHQNPIIFLKTRKQNKQQRDIPPIN
jgi:hypothetical protein